MVIDSFRSRRSPRIMASRVHLDLKTVNHRTADLFGCLAAFCLVVNFIIGSAAAYAFVLSGMLVFLSRFSASLSGIRKSWPLLTLPLMALISTFWSDAPSLTLRSGLQLILTFWIAAAIGNACSLRNIVLAVFFGYVAACCTAIPSIPNSLASGIPLQGAFESKNAFAIYAQMLMIFSLFISFDKSRSTYMRIFAFSVFTVASVMTALSQSRGAIVIAVLSTIMFLLLLLFSKAKLSFRILTLVFCLTFMIPVAWFAENLADFTMSVNETVLRKDATLTGRTDLWIKAKDLHSEAPLMGKGYQSFWREGNPDAEAIWRQFGISNRHGFNFHNEFFEILVSLGYFGTVILVSIWSYLTIFLAYKNLRYPHIFFSFFSSILAVFIMRSFAEVSIFNPFSLNAFILVFCYVASVSRSRIIAFH